MVAHPPLHPDGPLSLALAVVGSSTSPLLLLDQSLKIIAASTSFCLAFDVDPTRIVDRFLGDLGTGEWNKPQLRVLLDATAAGDAAIEAYEMDLKGARHGTRKLIIHAQRLVYSDADPIRLLLTVQDVTDARADTQMREDLLREKAILLQELQHRVANSLQIIASVILQSARKATSDETRTHLKDAHNRVMSVASLQQQLAASRLGTVELALYFTQLCRSIAASMIHDPARLSLRVEADDSITDAEVSVSLGLVVTELVINALKHAFPGGRSGAIVVGYHSHGPNWTLSVRDDGVGMPKDAASATPGLGTSIVEALSKQLNARIQVESGSHGTLVSVIHSQLAAVEEKASAV